MNRKKRKLNNKLFAALMTFVLLLQLFMPTATIYAEAKSLQISNK
ncbi:hypothetical protein [Oceanobacillus oncorhynchi]|nr:hypothetical protein [Oceanobacillus oncorhynchi]